MKSRARLPREPAAQSASRPGKLTGAWRVQVVGGMASSTRGLGQSNPPQPKKHSPRNPPSRPRAQRRWGRPGTRRRGGAGGSSPTSRRSRRSAPGWAAGGALGLSGRGAADFAAQIRCASWRGHCSAHRAPCGRRPHAHAPGSTLGQPGTCEASCFDFMRLVLARSVWGCLDVLPPRLLLAPSVSLLVAVFLCRIVDTTGW